MAQEHIQADAFVEVRPTLDANLQLNLFAGSTTNASGST